MLNDKVISTATQKILGFFCLHPEQKFHGRDIAKQMGERSSSVQRALKILEREKILIPEQKGRMIFYSLNEANPLVKPYKVVAIIAALEPLVKKLRKITDLIVLYGSSARGTYLTDSDVDLFVISSNEDDVWEILSRFSRNFVKEIKAVVHTLAEWTDVEEKNPVYAEEVNKGFILFQSEYYESRI